MQKIIFNLNDESTLKSLLDGWKLEQQYSQEQKVYQRWEKDLGLLSAISDVVARMIALVFNLNEPKEMFDSIKIFNSFELAKFWSGKRILIIKGTHSPVNGNNLSKQTSSLREEIDLSREKLNKLSDGSKQSIGGMDSFIEIDSSSDNGTNLSFNEIIDVSPIEEIDKQIEEIDSPNGGIDPLNDPTDLLVEVTNSSSEAGSPIEITDLSPIEEIDRQIEEIDSPNGGIDPLSDPTDLLVEVTNSSNDKIAPIDQSKVDEILKGLDQTFEKLDREDNMPIQLNDMLPEVNKLSIGLNDMMNQANNSPILDYIFSGEPDPSSNENSQSISRLYLSSAESPLSNEEVIQPIDEPLQESSSLIQTLQAVGQASSNIFQPYKLPKKIIGGDEEIKHEEKTWGAKIQTDAEILAIDLTPLSKDEVEKLFKSPYISVNKVNKETIKNNINKIPLFSFKYFTQEQVQSLHINELSLTQLIYIKTDYFSDTQLLSFDLSHFSEEELLQLEPSYEFMNLIRRLDFNTIVTHISKLPEWSYSGLLSPKNLEKIDVKKIPYDSVIKVMNDLEFQVRKLNINFVKSVLSLTPPKLSDSDEQNIDKKSTHILNEGSPDEHESEKIWSLIKIPYIYKLTKEQVDGLDLNALTFKQLCSICTNSISNNQASTIDLTRFSRKEIYILFKYPIYPLIKYLNPTTIAENISKIHNNHLCELSTIQLNEIDFSNLNNKQKSEFSLHQKSKMKNFELKPEERSFYKFENRSKNWNQFNNDNFDDIINLYKTALDSTKEMITGFNNDYPNEKPDKPMYNNLRTKILNQFKAITKDPRLVFDTDPTKVTKENVNTYWKKLCLYLHPDRHVDNKDIVSQRQNEEAETIFKFITAARNVVNPNLDKAYVRAEI
jgi:hypothetical protein